MVTILRSVRQPKRDEDGGVTVLSLFLLIAILVVGGLGLDVANAIQQRTQLQIAADAAAHAALYTRLRTYNSWDGFGDNDGGGGGGGPNPEIASKDLALSYASLNMPKSVFGNVLKREDVVFGVWDAKSRVFTPRQNSPNAVRVNTLRAARNGNPMGTYLLKLVGMGSFNLNADTVFEAYIPNCLRQGMVAQVQVKFTTQNAFSNGYCVHSNGTIEMRSDNRFELPRANVPDVNVSTPTHLAGIIGTADPLASNPGLAEAMTSNYYPLRDIVDLPVNIALLRDPLSPVQPSYITNTSVENINLGQGNQNLNGFHLKGGYVHILNCSNASRIVTVDQDTYFKDIVLVTNCQLKFNQGVIIENSIIATTNTAVDSLNSPSGLQVGRNDKCVPGGGSKLLTLGGFKAAADLQVYGSQIIAAKDIYFAAKPDGLYGASFISGTTVETTSQGNFAFCPYDLEIDDLSAAYFRMVR